MTARRTDTMEPGVFFVALMSGVAAIVLALGGLGLLFSGHASWPWLFLGSAILLVTSGYLLAGELGAWRVFYGGVD